MDPRAARGRDPLGGLFAALAAVQFGGVVILGKIVGRRGLPVPSMLAVRFAVAAVVLAAILAAARQPLLPAPGEGKRMALLGLGYAVESTLFFVALGRGTATAVTLLFFTYPVWVAALGAALGMGLPGWLVGGALAAAVAGAALVVTASGGIDITSAGILLALAAAVTFSVYLIGAEAWVRRTSSPASALWVGAWAAVALAVFSGASGEARFPAGAVEWGPVAGMGGLTAGAFLCLFLGLRRLGAVRASVVAALEPVAASVLAFAILDERISAGVIGGGALILAGAVAASLARGALRPAGDEVPKPEVP